MWERLLRKFIVEPLQSKAEIDIRQNGVEELFKNIVKREEIISYLKEINDIERLCGRISYNSLTPTDCVSLKNSLKLLPKLKEVIGQFKSKALKTISSNINEHLDVVNLLDIAIVDKGTPTNTKDGGFIKDGYSKELDELRYISTNSNQIIEQMAIEEQKATGIKNLRIGYNRVFGYYIEVTNSQKNLALQKLKFAEDYILNDCSLKKYMRPGRLIIVDLRDEFIEKNEALGLFVVMLNIFASVKDIDGKQFNKFIVFDEAHKYMNDKDLVGSITTAIREMRHKGVSIMIASQDPMSLPSEIIELSSIVIMHKFSSPAWVKHVQKAITALQTLTPMAMSSLTSGEAFLWANKATDRMFTQRPVKISIRPRVTKHGGDTINAVK